MNRILALNTLRKCVFQKFNSTLSITSCHNRKYSVVSMSENGPNPYIERINESITDKRARLLYQSRKRGMLENGLILSTFAGKYLNNFNNEQLALYDKLINIPSNDWDLFYWATGVKSTPPEFQNEVMELLKRHVKNELKETRYTQPDLN
ncbi:succinate dehydrogenase assembly factor 2, mitochondrial-like [Argiope bruennichi]|uniref:succinate dehydrogenase assembly factor 2, mitochondrial-like n=1 Tax=Argiope bruennichi TaxID=94029 RepID=UPI002493FFE6|nr:succinate dehydrogenase assembly factor 2, mitochondrial-like [Argiope bruennichi]